MLTRDCSCFVSSGRRCLVDVEKYFRMRRGEEEGKKAASGMSDATSTVDTALHAKDTCKGAS